jgi:hypothetical protein
MSIENTLERIAVALEKLVEVKSNPVVVLPAPVNEGPAPMPPQEVRETLQDAGVIKTADDFAERDAVKAELTKMNIPFNNKARTEVLKKLLEDQKAAIAVPAEEKAIATAPAPVKEPFGVDIVRESVKKFAAIKGKDKAVGLLVEYGAEKVSDLKVEQYAGIVEKINKALEA